MDMVDQLERLKNLSPVKRALLLKALREGQAPKEAGAAIRRRPGQGHAPLSFAQQRLWFIDQLRPGNPAYNVPAAVRLQGWLNVCGLEQSINEVVRRHESLRTTFTARGDQPEQVISPALALKVRLIDLHGVAPDRREAKAFELASKEASSPFDLSRGPLIRATLLQLDEQEHILLITLHHIIS